MIANLLWQDVERFTKARCWLLQGVKVRTVKSGSLENFAELSQLYIAPSSGSVLIVSAYVCFAVDSKDKVPDCCRVF
jgi:hypothetical protein